MCVRTTNNTLLLVQNIENTSLKSKHPASGTNEHLPIIHPATTCQLLLNQPADLK